MTPQLVAIVCLWLMGGHLACKCAHSKPPTLWHKAFLIAAWPVMYGISASIKVVRFAIGEARTHAASPVEVLAILCSALTLFIVAIVAWALVFVA